MSLLSDNLTSSPFKNLREKFAVADSVYPHVNDLLSVYFLLGSVRATLDNLNSMSEDDFNDHINMNQKFNYFSIIEDFNYISGFVFQLEKEFWNSSTFTQFDEKIKWYFNDVYMKSLSCAQKYGPSDYDEFEYLTSGTDYSIYSMQIGRSSLEHILSELRYIEQKHRVLNPEFVSRIKARADWLENELKKTDPILRKMFLKKDKKILTPMYNIYNNQNFWWENTETIQKLMEENG